MTGTERKRAWRLRNPDRSREYERDRAKTRRWDTNNSYWRYEKSFQRGWQRTMYAIGGAGFHRMTKKEREARLDALEAVAMAVAIKGLQERQVARRLRP